MIPGTVSPPLLMGRPHPFTAMLLHLDGADGSTTFTDATGRHTFSAIHNAQIDTADSKFGGASLLLDGVQDGIETAASNDFEFLSHDFTIEGWVKSTNNSGGHILIGKNGGGLVSPFLIFISDDPAIKFAASSNGTTYDIANEGLGFGTLTGAWQHWAISRVGNTIYGGLGGTIGRTWSVTGKSLYNNGLGLTIGCADSVASYGSGFAGWQDEMRIKKGVGLYTTTYTPPTGPFTS